MARAKKTVVKTTITIEELQDALDHDNTSKIIHLITFNNEAQCVVDIKRSVFDGVDYLPWMFDFALRRCVLNKFANVELDAKKQDAIFDFCYGGYYDALKKSLNGEQLYRIEQNAKLAIEHQKNLVEAMVGHPEIEVYENINAAINSVKTIIGFGKDLMANVNLEDLAELVKTSVQQEAPSNLSLFKKPE